MAILDEINVYLSAHSPLQKHISVELSFAIANIIMNYAAGDSC